MAPLVQALGEAFMLEPATRAAGRELGYPGWPFYLAGRAGVLGAVRPDVLTAVLAFFPPAFVREQWTAALDVGPLDRAVAAYVEQSRRWGREHLTGAPALDRLCALSEKVVAGAPIAGRPLFAGWAALPLPDGGLPARAGQLMQVLREHRGGAHKIALLATGLPVLTAVLADPASGPDGARYFRWPEPYRPPRPAELELWRGAQDATDALVARDLQVLIPDERAELVELLSAAFAHAFGSAQALASTT